MADPCEHGNGASDSIKERNLLEKKKQLLVSEEFFSLLLITSYLGDQFLPTLSIRKTTGFS